MDSTKFEDLSYKAHQKRLKKIVGVPTTRMDLKDSIGYWRHDRMYQLTTPLLEPQSKWLTVGDGIGTDAHWLLDQGIDTVASDLSDIMLQRSQEKGYIKTYSKVNAEKIFYDDNSFDYILCKEAYHHFPRPYLAIYEMLRVTSKAIILIEPIDIGIQMPLMIFLKNVLDRINPNLINKIWKNRFSFEPVGNYVYKVSEREIEKIAMGIGLEYIAFKGLNDYHNPKALDYTQPTTNTKELGKFKSKVWFRDLLCKLSLIPPHLMGTIIFKTAPSESVKAALKKEGYKLIKLAPNPYLT